MAVNSLQPTELCVITLLVLLFILDDQDVPFLEFVLLSIVVLVFPTQAFLERGGLENLATGHGTWERAEVRGVWATDNSPRVSSVLRDRPTFQQHLVSPLQPPSPPRGGADPGQIFTWERAEFQGVWATENITHMSAVCGDRPAFQQHVGSPLQPPSPPHGEAEPGRIVTVASIRNHFVQLFPLFPPLIYNNPLEAYDMLVKE